MGKPEGGSFIKRGRRLFVDGRRPFVEKGDRLLFVEGGRELFVEGGGCLSKGEAIHHLSREGGGHLLREEATC